MHFYYQIERTPGYQRVLRKNWGNAQAFKAPDKPTAEHSFPGALNQKLLTLCRREKPCRLVQAEAQNPLKTIHQTPRPAAGPETRQPHTE